MSSIQYSNNYDSNSEFNFEELKRISPFESIKLSNKTLRNDSEKNRFYLYQQTNYLINNNPLMRKIFLNNYDSNKNIIINDNKNNKNIPSLLRKKKLKIYNKLIDNNSYKNFKLNIEDLHYKKDHILNFSPFSTNSKLFTNSIEKETPKLNKNYSQKNLNLNSIESSTLYLTKKSKISLSSSNVSLSIINNNNEDYNSEKNFKANKNIIINNKKKDLNNIYKISNKLFCDSNEINSNIKLNLKDEFYITNFRNFRNYNNIKNKLNEQFFFPSLENILKKYKINENNNHNNEKTIIKSKSLSNFDKVSINLNKFNENNYNYYPELFIIENDKEKNKNKKFVKNFGSHKYMLMKEGNFNLTNYGDIFCKMKDEFFEKNKMIILKKYPELDADLKFFVKDINKDKKIINEIKKFNNNHNYIIHFENKNKKLFDKVKKKVEFEIKKNKKLEKKII